MIVRLKKLKLQTVRRHRVCLRRFVSYLASQGLSFPAEVPIVTLFVATQAALLNRAEMRIYYHALIRAYLEIGVDLASDPPFMHTVRAGIGDAQPAPTRHNRVVTSHDLRTIFESMGRDTEYVRDRAMLALFHLCGAAGYELEKLRVQDISFCHQGVQDAKYSGAPQT